MDGAGSFSKALPEKGLVEKGKEAKGGKKIQTKIHHSFFLSMLLGKRSMSQLSYERVKNHVVSNV